MTKQTLGMAALVAIIFMALAFIYRGPQPDAPPPGSPTAPPPAAVASKPETAGKPQEPTAAPVPKPDEKVKVETLKAGSGAAPKDGQLVSLNYRLTLQDGKEVDSSYKRGKPFEFTLGQHQVVPGFEHAVLASKVGGKVRATVPPGLGYGESGQGPIPGNSTLIFEIELIGAQ